MKKVILLTGLFAFSIGMAQQAKCPVTGLTASSSKESNGYEENYTMDAKNQTTASEKGSSQSNKSKVWWPNQLNLEVLRQNSNLSNPMGAEFDYAKEFKTLDYT